VYAVWVRVHGSFYGGMMNIGIRPTFEGTSETLEVNIFGFDRDIYGKEVQIQFVDRVRDEKTFDGFEELIDQLDKDKKRVEEILNNSSPDIAKRLN
jgi:riboflavin kinase / FMN adenylyltransferase